MLHLICGKIASGKSTLTAQLGASAGTIVISEDDWLAALYADELSSLSVPHTLHYLDVPDAVCKARLHLRNARGDHAFAVTDEQFDQISRHFVAPGPQEGFDIIVHRSDAVQ